MSRTQQIEYKGKNIFCIDFSNVAKASEIKEIIHESVQYIRSQPAESVLTLTNVTGMSFSNEIKELFNDFIKGDKPYIKASAVYGLNGLQIIFSSLLRITDRSIKNFTGEQEAKDWLISLV